MKADINKDITTYIHNELSIRIKHRNEIFFLKQTNSDLIAQGPLVFFFTIKVAFPHNTVAPI